MQKSITVRLMNITELLVKSVNDSFFCHTLYNIDISMLCSDFFVISVMTTADEAVAKW